MPDLVSLEDSMDDDTPGGDSSNVLNILRSKLETVIDIPLVEISVPERPGVSLLFKPEVTSAQLRAWHKRNSNKRGELDNLKFSCMIIAAMNQGFRVNDEDVYLDNGDPMLINSAEFAEMMNVDKSEIIPEGLKDLFVRDAHIEATAMRLLDEAGYGDNVDLEEDPTKAS